jgi:two-component system, cell cycle response regulator
VKAELLVIEDSAVQGEHMRGVLERLGYRVRWAASGMRGLALARERPPDLILLDVVMEDMDGFQVCRWLKLHEETREIPVIMLTVRSEVADRVAGLQVGADDYLPKPFAEAELEARIYAALRVKTAQQELRNRNTELESMLRNVELLAVTDSLTGLFNRRRFADVLRREFAVARRYDSELSCMMVDLDHFKVINDSHGHDAGDQALREFAQVLSMTLREVDLAARYGGEEFAIILPQTTKARAEVVAARIRGLVHGRSFQAGDRRVALTASFGIADVRDVAGGDPTALVHAADTAMYEAKRRGRDCVVVFSPDLAARDSDASS